MRKVREAVAMEPICRTVLGRMVVRRLMKHGARGAAEEILNSAAEILRRKVRTRTATFVLERSVENRQLHLHLHWLLKHRVSGGSLRLLEDFRRKAVASIVKAASREPAVTMDRRLAAAILKSYTDNDPGRPQSAARGLSARQAYGARS
jgi:ribosomal protein S7